MVLIVVDPKGENIEKIELPKKAEDQLSLLQEKIGGYIEMFFLNMKKKYALIFDEEGKLKHLPKNEAYLEVFEEFLKENKEPKKNINWAREQLEFRNIVGVVAFCPKRELR